MEILININSVSYNEHTQIVLPNICINYLLEVNEQIFETHTHIFFIYSNYPNHKIASFFDKNSAIEEADVLRFFKNDGICISINKKTETILFSRDVAGLCTLYFNINEKEIKINTNVHHLAKSIKAQFNKKSIFQLLYFDYLWDGQTIYNTIEELKVGQTLSYNKFLQLNFDKLQQPVLDIKENKLSENDNILKLREEIVKAHKNYLDNKNIVYLSGGIDSVAMLIALDDLVEKNRITNHSFKVKGTKQDETGYAKSIADHLNINLDIIERDISGEITKETFKNAVLRMNNPYTGIWTFSNQVNDKKNQIYYAGQDTRLHTPALNILDKLAFNIFNLSPYLKYFYIILDLGLYPLKFAFNKRLEYKNTTNKIFLGLRRALYLFNTSEYLKHVYFKVDKSQQKAYKLPIKFYDEIEKDYNLSLKGIDTKRGLYNYLVSKKWIEQYVNDIRYMIDMVKTQGGKLAMPFYDMDLAIFSASIPFDLATKVMKGKSKYDDKTTTVNKYVLRASLKDKIDAKTYLRSKAASQTEHLTFNQGLADVLKYYFNQDLKTSNSFIKAYDLENFIVNFMKNNNEFTIKDEKYLLKIYYLGTLLIYNNNLAND